MRGAASATADRAAFFLTPGASLLSPAVAG
jgi:hypothetical protein